MVVVISPSQTEGVVAALLHPAGEVTGQPIDALGPADDVGGEVPAQLPYETVRDPEDFHEDPGLIFAGPRPVLPRLHTVQIGTQIGVLEIDRLVTAAPSPFDNPEGGFIFRIHKSPAVGAERSALDLRA